VHHWLVSSTAITLIQVWLLVQGFRDANMHSKNTVADESQLLPNSNDWSSHIPNFA